MNSVVLAELTAICMSVLRRKACSSSTWLKRALHYEEQNEPGTFCHHVRKLPQSRLVTGLRAEHATLMLL